MVEAHNPESSSEPPPPPQMSQLSGNASTTSPKTSSHGSYLTQLIVLYSFMIKRIATDKKVLVPSPSPQEVPRSSSRQLLSRNYSRPILHIVLYMPRIKKNLPWLANIEHNLPD
ncbi:hypothetical protein PAXRUDRAFT_769372 [Paxillus rubicundulus Ve08.2h10]|uniref:Uncharacterized protein n=1 Tax=Paxillus rubicundulus Ve08.2h10 TaxID=930991 RepID=A0A0D0D747_9AGAM|nr:hypothetical protein PAXRUDRAFT_769372 [Paxillus rubicundulus Ve08.2h10]